MATEATDVSTPGSPAFSQDEVQRFERDGYLIVRGLADAETVSLMKAACEDQLRREVGPVEYESEVHYPGAPASLDAVGGRTVRRLKLAHARHPVFTEWISQPSFVNRLHQLMGPDVVMPLAHHNCIMTKQPRFSSDTGWHQDVRYWSFERPELISTWLALTPERIENGCLHVIPGTHRMHLSRERFDEVSFLRTDLPENEELIAKKVTAELEPGDVLFFHCLTFHAATRNHTDRSKYSVVFTFRPADNLPKPGSRSASLPELLIPRA